METKTNKVKEQVPENTKNALVKPIKPYKVKIGQGRMKKGETFKPPVVPTHSEIIEKRIEAGKTTAAGLQKTLKISADDFKSRLKNNDWNKEMLQRLADEHIILWKSEEQLAQETKTSANASAPEVIQKCNTIIQSQLKRGRTTIKFICDLLEISQPTFKKRMKDNGWKKYMLQRLSDEHIIVWEDPDDKFYNRPSI